MSYPTWQVHRLQVQAAWDTESIVVSGPPSFLGLPWRLKRATPGSRVTSDQYEVAVVRTWHGPHKMLLRWTCIGDRSFWSMTWPWWVHRPAISWAGDGPPPDFEGFL